MHLSISLNDVSYPARFGIRQNVLLNTGGSAYNNAYVSAVVFTEGKVRYNLLVEINGGLTEMHNIDSAFVEAGVGAPLAESTVE